MNKVILVGNLTKNPELKQTQNGISVTRFTVAVNRPYSKDKDNGTDFISCTAWRQTAEFIARNFSKGQRIEIDGSLRVDSWQNQQTGKQEYSTSVTVNNVEFGGAKSDNHADPIDRVADEYADITEQYNDDDLPF